MLGLGISLARGAFASIVTYVKDGLKLFYNFKIHQDNPISHASAGSTSFDGTNDYIDCGTGVGTSLGDNYSGSLTVSLWFKADAYGDDGMFELTGTFNNSGSGDFNIVANSSHGLRFALNGDGWYRRYTFSDTASWHHIVCVYDTSGESASKIYLDGSSVSTATVGTFPSDADMDLSGLKTYIGGYYGSSFLFNGSMANIGIWSRALSASEVQGVMYKKYADLSSADQVSLVSWYGLDAESLGDELVSNGTFDADTTGWTPADGATVTWQSGRMRVDGYTGTANQAITTIVGKTYTISADMFVGTSASVALYISTTTSTGGSISSQASTGSWNFTATATTLYVICRVNAASATYVEFDNISIKELTLDDSHSTNHGSPVGSTTNATVYGGNAPSKPRILDSAPDVVDNYGTLHSGTALSFDGTNDYVGIGDVGFDVYSLSLWFDSGENITASTGGQSVIGLNGTGYSGIILGSFTSGIANELITIIGETASNRLYYASSTDSIPSGWNHLAISWDSSASEYKMYLNGDEKSLSGTTGGLIDASAVNLGKRNDELAHWYSGKISNVKVFNSALTLSEIQEMYLNPEQILPTGVASSNLKLYLPMNEGSGTTNYDGSGNQNDGTISGATWVKAETDIAQVGLVRQNKPMVFDGVNDYVDTGTPFSNTNHTISGWIKTIDDGNTKTIFDSRDTANDGIVIFANSSENVGYYMNDKYLTSSNTYSNEWIHIACSYDGTTQKLYINGSLDQSLTTTKTISTTTNALIGARSFTSQTNLFKGLISDVAIWDEALTATEITALYNSGTPLDASVDSGNYASSIGLQGYWRNDGDTTWTDRTPLGAYGSELVTNGTFDADSNWTKNTGWSISSDLANCDGSQSGISYLYQDTGIVVGREYTITFDMSNYSAGSLRVRCGGSASGDGVSGYYNANQSIEVQLTGTGTGDNLFFEATASFVGSIDNVSIKRYRGGNDGTVAGSPDSIVLTEGITSGRDSQGFYLTDTTENCLTVNGAEYVEIPDSDVLDNIFENGGTFGMWVYPTIGTSNQALVDKTKHSIDIRNQNLITVNQIFSGTNGQWKSDADTITLNQWQHIVIAYNSSSNANNPIFYINGSSITVNRTITPSGTFTSDVGFTLRFGTENATTDWLLGKMDDIRIYSKVLSATEVTKNYNAGLSKHRN